MDYLKKLEELGLSEKEVLVYTKALEMGQFTISSIAHESGVKRPTCYLVIDELIKKGFITLIPRGRKALYHAESPEIIVRETENKVAIAKQILPHLQQIKIKNIPTPTIQFFTGKHGIETIYNDVLKIKSGDCILTLTPGEQLTSVVGRKFLEDWIEKRVKKGIHSKNILPAKDRSRTVFVATDKKVLRETRYLPSSFDIPATIGVYGNKVAFFSSEKEKIGFIVKSKEFSDTIKGVFQHLWQVGSR